MAKEFAVKLTVDSSGAITNLDDFKTEVEEANGATMNMRKELKTIQQLLLGLDPNDKEWKQLSDRASQIKDRMKETAEVINANAAPAFESLGNNTSILKDQLRNLDFDGVAMTAKGMATSLKQIKPKDLVSGFKDMASSLGSLGKVLLTNPIFLIGAAIAAIIVNFQELKGLVDGVSSSQKESLALAEANANEAQRQLDLIGQSENILKLQGKSEREILDLKMAQTQAAINEQKVVIAGLESIQDSQIAAAERNKGILVGILNFITLPIRALLMQIDAIGAGLVKLGVLEKGLGLTEMLDSGVNLLAKQMFDPDAVKKEGEAAIQAAKDKLLGLENQLAGHKLSVNKINSDAAKAAADAQKAADEAELKRREKFHADKLEIERKGLVQVQAQEVGLKQATNAQLLTEDQKRAAAEREEQNARTERLKQNANNSLAISSEALGGLTALNEVFAGKSKKQQEAAFKRQKAINIAGAIIDTYKAANAALATYPPPFGAIAAGASIAVGLANVMKIKNQKFEGGGSSGSSGGSGGGSPSIGSGANAGGGQPAFNPINTAFINNRPPQTAQAYVLAGSVSNAQDANAKIKNLARLG
jgi:hypothetical protein